MSKKITDKQIYEEARKEFPRELRALISKYRGYANNRSSLLAVYLQRMIVEETIIEADVRMDDVRRRYGLGFNIGPG